MEGLRPKESRGVEGRGRLESCPWLLYGGWIGGNKTGAGRSGSQLGWKRGVCIRGGGKRRRSRCQGPMPRSFGEPTPRPQMVREGEIQDKVLWLEGGGGGVGGFPEEETQR